MLARITKDAFFFTAAFTLFLSCLEWSKRLFTSWAFPSWDFLSILHECKLSTKLVVEYAFDSLFQEELPLQFYCHFFPLDDHEQNWNLQCVFKDNKWVLHHSCRMLLISALFMVSKVLDKERSLLARNVMKSSLLNCVFYFMIFLIS